MTKRKGLFGIAAATVAFIAWRTAVTLNYRAQGTGLIAEALSFPKEYSVGAGTPTRMVVLGDSTAAGVGAETLESSLPYVFASRLGKRVSVTNLAVSGATTWDVVRGQLPNLPDEPADLVLISISANDASHGTSPSDLQDDLKAILDGLKAHRVTTVVLTTTPNFRTTPALPLLLNRLFERRASALSATIHKIAERYPFVHIADLNREGTLNQEQYAADGFHPNPAGYRLWASICVRALEP